MKQNAKKILEICGCGLSSSSIVGMVLFSSYLVLVVGLEEKNLERQTWDRAGRRQDRAREANVRQVEKSVDEC